MSVYGGPDIVDNGLVLYLDAANRRSYPGSGTSWTDVSGNGNNGTLTNGPTFNGDNGGSIVFDGVNDFMDSSFVIQAATSATLQSYCSWLYGTTTSNNFFGSNADSTGKFHLILQFTSNGQLEFGGSFFGGGGAPDSTSPVTVNANSTWNYGCVVKTAASTFDVYLNGQRVITGANRTANASSNFNFGRRWSTSYVPSRIGKVHIYNRALTAAEILQNYNATRSRFGV
jgi:hypothetical protein